MGLIEMFHHLVLKLGKQMLIGEDPKLDWKEFVVLTVLRQSSFALHEEVEEVFDDIAVSLRKGE
jgi:hypothetical protein